MAPYTSAQRTHRRAAQSRALKTLHAPIVSNPTEAGVQVALMICALEGLEVLENT
jgi:hypothetical protein